MEERIVATGKIFELVQLPQKDGRIFEVARRAPGVRVVIADIQRRELLLTKEHRWELKTWDYRLPGGKVFDSLAEFEEYRRSGNDIVGAAAKKAKEEAAEEAGVVVRELSLFKKSSLGATVEWDLYIFESAAWQFHAEGQNLKEDERQGIEVKMYPYAEVEQMILNGNLQEDRVALVLLQWLKQA